MRSLEMKIATSTCMALALTLLSGCQQPARCGAIGEPCCLVEGAGYGCVAGAFCNRGACRPTGPASCAGPAGACDIGLQGCAGQQSCQLGDGTTFCEASGEGIDGDPCTSTVDCSTGHYCSAVSGLCHRYCCRDESSCVPGQACLPSGQGDVGFCVGNPCDPVTGGGCPAGVGCYIVTNSAGAFLTTCLPSGAGTNGSACELLNDCAPGFACTTSDVCRQFCRPSDPSTCTGVCTAVAGVNDLGLCN